MPPTKKTPAKSALGDPDLLLIASLADILNDTGLSEIELDRKGTKFRVAKQLTAVAQVASAPPAPAVHAHAAPLHEAPAPAPKPARALAFSSLSLRRWRGSPLAFAPSSIPAGSLIPA